MTLSPATAYRVSSRRFARHRLFNAWLQIDPEQRTTQGLLDAINFDYFKLLDLLTLARSRKHIEKYYDLSEVGPFPERKKPINIKADIDSQDIFPGLHEINRDIRRLNLTAITSDVGEAEIVTDNQ